jgi:hypothetical protein
MGIDQSINSPHLGLPLTVSLTEGPEGREMASILVGFISERNTPPPTQTQTIGNEQIRFW